MSPVGVHEDATMAKDSLHWGGGCWNAVDRVHKVAESRHLNCSLQRMFLTVTFGDEDANSRNVEIIAYNAILHSDIGLHSWC